jgi:transposase-like protein
MAKFNIKLLTKAHYKTDHSYHLVDPIWPIFLKKKGQNNGAAHNFRCITTVSTTGVNEKKKAPRVKYSESYKMEAVKYYVAQNGSMTLVAVANKFKVHVPTFRYWVIKYSDYKNLSKHSESYKMEAVKYYMEHNITQSAASIKFDVAVSTFNSWVKKYSKLYEAYAFDAGHITFLTGLNSQSPGLSIAKQYRIINKYSKTPIAYGRVRKLLENLKCLK